jgi:hypothetical protein
MKMNELLPAGSMSGAFGDIAASITDVATDVAGGIPVVGAALNAAKAAKNISNTLYLKKVCGILDQIGTDSTSAQRENFLAKLKDDAELARFGEAIIFLSDKIDHLEKPAVVGRLLAAAIRGELDRGRALRLSSIVAATYIEDLKILPSIEHSRRAPTTEQGSLLTGLGLLDQTGLEIGGAVVYNVALSSFALDIIKFGLKPR